MRLKSNADWSAKKLSKFENSRKTTTFLAGVRLVVLYRYPILILIFLNNGCGLIQSGILQRLTEAITNVYIKPDFATTILWSFIALLPFIYELKGKYSNIFTIFPIILLVKINFATELF